MIQSIINGAVDWIRSGSVREATKRFQPKLLWLGWLLLGMVVACTSDAGVGDSDRPGNQASSEPVDLVLPALESVPANERPIRVVATTGIIGDVVASVAGDAANVTVLMAANQDPHAYHSTAGDLRLAADAHVVFVNGWRLEESLIDDLTRGASGTPIAPLSAGIEPRLFADGDSGSGENNREYRVDPHVWLAPLNVLQWVNNVESTLISLDPDNAESYAQRADAFRSKLEELDSYYRERIEVITPERRVLVTNHDAFGYFADAYGFEVVGTVIPGDSTLAEPASGDLAALLRRMEESSVCSIFVEQSANQQLAEQLAADLDHCETVQVVPLYSGALGEPGSGAESYLEMMRVNIDAIVEALQRESRATSEE